MYQVQEITGHMDFISTEPNIVTQYTKVSIKQQSNVIHSNLFFFFIQLVEERVQV
jgi:hypothetical protein